MNEKVWRNVFVSIGVLIFCLLWFGTSRSDEPTSDTTLNADSHWMLWDDNKATGSMWEVKTDSLNFAKDEDGNPYFAVLYRSSDDKTTPRVYTFHLLLVSWKDCEAGAGNLVVLTAGSEKTLIHFDKTLTNNATRAARQICVSGATVLQRQEQQNEDNKKNPKYET